MHTPTMPFAQYGHQASGTFNSVVTYASWAVTAACAAEVFYVFQHGKDLLAGFGLVHSHHDAISLLKFYGITGVVAFSLATHKYLKVTAAGLAIATLAGMYGTQFHLKAERTFDTANLPTVTSPKLGTGDASRRDVATQHYDMNQCSFHNPILGRVLNEQEKNECIQVNKTGDFNSKWAKNCGCGTPTTTANTTVATK